MIRNDVELYHLPKEILIKMLLNINVDHLEEVRQLNRRVEELEKITSFYRNSFGAIECFAVDCNKTKVESLYVCIYCQKITCFKHMTERQRGTIGFSGFSFQCCDGNGNGNGNIRQELGDYDLDMYNRSESEEY